MQPRCPECPSLNPGSPYCSQPISGDGPMPCNVMCLGAGPSKHEVARCRAYAGPAGEELNDTYLPRGGLRRGETVWIDNCAKCWDGSDKTAPDKRVLACARWHLPHLLKQVRPKVLVLMGGAPCKLSDRRIRLDLHRGIPQWGTVLDRTWEGWIWPMFEPALGMRDTPRMTQILDDWRNFGKWMKGEWEPPHLAPIPLDYQLLRTWEPLHEYLQHPAMRIEAGLDTESHAGKLWSVQVSHTPGTGRMILAEDRELVRKFAEWTHTASNLWYLHYANADLDPCEDAGIALTNWRDTLQEAYHTNSLPQGLKALVFRLFGYEMRSWEDTVWPASVDAVIGWMREAAELAAANLGDTDVKTLKKGKCGACGHPHSTGKCARCGCDQGIAVARVYETRTPKRGAAESILRHIVLHTEATRDDDKPYNPFKNLKKMREEGLRGKVAERWEWEFLEEELGAMPQLGIANCPLDIAIPYAIGDADFELRVARRLKEERTSDRYKVDQGDWDQ